MEASNQLHAPAVLPPGKKPGTHQTEGSVDVQEKGKCLAFAKIKTPDCPAHSLVTILSNPSNKDND
jgi:hypothetical protein